MLTGVVALRADRGGEVAAPGLARRDAHERVAEVVARGPPEVVTGVALS